jgi:hypothetical protein
MRSPITALNPLRKDLDKPITTTCTSKYVLVRACKSPVTRRIASTNRGEGMIVDSLPDGITLNRSPLGSYSVDWNGHLIGWIHASLGNKWSAYARSRTPDAGSLPLGRFTQREAMRMIASTAGWKNVNETRTVREGHNE